MTAYQRAGVDISAGEALVAGIKADVQSTWGPEVQGDFGGFAGGIALPPQYRDPVVVMSTDGCGTKAEVARQAGLFDGLGYDLVAACIDDLAAAGAVPLALTDYLTVGRLDVAWATQLISSIAAACRAGGVALLGGETAEHPGVMEPDEFDLAGTAIGVMEKGTGIDGSVMRTGDVVIGLTSPNVRANGFSLIRAGVLPRVGLDSKVEGGTLAEVLLEPSVIYAPAVVEMTRTLEIRGLAHITGGGLVGNVRRILWTGLDARIEVGSWKTPPIFGLIESVAEVDRADMFATFNMGIGFVVVVEKTVAPAAIDVAARHGIGAQPIGTIAAGEGAVRIG